MINSNVALDLKQVSGTPYWRARGADTWNPFKQTEVDINDLLPNGYKQTSHIINRSVVKISNHELCSITQNDNMNISIKCILSVSDVCPIITQPINGGIWLGVLNNCIVLRTYNGQNYISYNLGSITFPYELNIVFEKIGSLWNIYKDDIKVGTTNSYSYLGSSHYIYLFNDGGIPCNALIDYLYITKNGSNYKFVAVSSVFGTGGINNRLYEMTSKTFYDYSDPI